MYFEGKIILITGGAGSFGQKCTEILLRDHNPSSVRIFDHNEFAIVDMERKFRDSRLRFFAGDVRDKDRLSRAMHGVDIVFHAAALKHVPVCEYNPVEAIKTNIDGTMNCIDAAIDNEVEKAVLISTDKAVSPVNLYGATKLCAEKLFIQGNSYVGKRKTRFGGVRYGNVIGSRGSVVPLFFGQKASGVLTVTDERMTRFWITLDQGIQFVLDSVEKIAGGELFVPKIPSMKIIDLAKVIAPESKIEINGIRPGEKLHEILIMPEEARRAREHDGYFVIDPEFRFWDNVPGRVETGQALPEGFRYSSDSNTQWVAPEQMAQILTRFNGEQQ